MRPRDSYDLVWCLVILILVTCLLLLAVAGIRSADLKEANQQLSACTQQVDWWRKNFGVETEP